MPKIPIPQSFDINDYFARIGYKDGTNIDVTMLKNIMRHQLCTIPFENIDVWKYKKIVSLDTGDIVQKLVYSKRGGYCYELNGLFCMVLEALGFEYEILGARPRFNYTTRRPKTHMVVLVRLGDKEYLCDLGFGGYGIREPIDLAMSGCEIDQDGDKVKLSVENGEYVVSTLLDGEFRDLYSFDLAQTEWIDFELANYFNSTSPKTVFTNKKMALIQKEDCRVFLIDNELKIIKSGGVEKITVTDDEYSHVLKRYFWIEV